MMIKKIFLAMFFILLARQSASAANYVQIPFQTGVCILLDTDSIEVHDDHVRAWLKLVPGADSLTGFQRGTHPDAVYFTQLTAFQKARKSYQILEFKYYDENEELLIGEEFPYEEDFFQGIPAGSYIGTVYDEVMKRIN